MATVNMLYTCTAGYKNEKPNDDDDGGGFFSPHSLPLTCIRFLGLSTIFLFPFLTAMIFLFMYRFHCWSLNILHTIISYSFLAFAIFHYIRFYIYRWKPTVIRHFSIGWSALHWLKQYQCAYYTPCWIHTI